MKLGLATGEKRFVYQEPTWAVERGGTLFVSHAHHDLVVRLRGVR